VNKTLLSSFGVNFLKNIGNVREVREKILNNDIQFTNKKDRKNIKDAINTFLSRNDKKHYKSQNFIVRDKYVVKYRPENHKGYNNVFKRKLDFLYFNQRCDKKESKLDVEVKKLKTKPLEEHNKYCKDLLWYSKRGLDHKELKLAISGFDTMCSHVLNIIERDKDKFNVIVKRNNILIGTFEEEEWYSNFKKRIKTRRKYYEKENKKNKKKQIKNINLKKVFNLENCANFYINMLKNIKAKEQNSAEENVKKEENKKIFLEKSYATLEKIVELSYTLDLEHTCSCFLKKKSKNFHSYYKHSEKKNKYVDIKKFSCISEAALAYKHYVKHLKKILKVVLNKLPNQMVGKVLDFQKIARENKNLLREKNKDLDILSLGEKEKAEKKEFLRL